MEELEGSIPWGPGTKGEQEKKKEMIEMKFDQDQYSIDLHVVFSEWAVDLALIRHLKKRQELLFCFLGAKDENSCSCR